VRGRTSSNKGRRSPGSGRRRVAKSGAASDQPRTWLAGYEGGTDGIGRSVVRGQEEGTYTPEAATLQIQGCTVHAMWTAWGGNHGVTASRP
jgi:hypothetical protein